MVKDNTEMKLYKNASINKLLIVFLLLMVHLSCKSQKEITPLTLNKEDKINTTARGLLNVQSFGDQGEAVIFIHGLGSNARAWQKLTPLMQNDFRVYTLDLPKYLDTDDKSLVSIDKYAKLVGRFIKELDEEKVHLVGHSMGGQIAVRVALDQTQVIASLSLLAPAGLEQFSESDNKWFDTWVTKKFYLSLSEDAISKNFDINFYESKLPKDASFMLEDRLLLKSDSIKYNRYLDYVLKSINSMLDQTVFDELVHIKVPTIVFFGSHDHLIPNKILHPQLTVTDILDLAKSIPNVELHMIGEAGHFIQWDQPSEIAKHLSTFLNKNFTNE